MTLEQKQIAIAEWEGIPTKKVWRVRYKDKSFDYPSEIEASTMASFACHSFGLNKDEVSPPEEAEVPSRLPPYLTSRDAICGAVGKLDDVSLREYAKRLQEVCHHYCVGVVPDYQHDLRSLAKITLATPAQMADALLLTLGFEV